jgi:hypothetical protein
VREKSTGYVQLSDITGTPLVWAGSDTLMAATWLSLAMGQPRCDYATWTCYITRHAVTATINGSVTTMEPFSTAHIGGYSLAIGEASTRSSNRMFSSQSACSFDGPPQFAAAAVREP